MADTPDAPAEHTLDDLRRRLRLELTTWAGVPEDRDLSDAADLADLVAVADAYTKLGGDLELAPPVPPARFNPADVKLRELVRGAAWQAANDAGAEAATADTIAAKVAEALEELAR